MNSRRTKSLLVAFALSIGVLAAGRADAVIAIIAPATVGIAFGQTVRLTIVNRGSGRDTERGIIINWFFLDAGGRVLKRASECVEIPQGQMKSFDLSHAEIGGRIENRVQLRAMAVALGGPDTKEGLSASVEVFDDATGRTTVFDGNPGLVKGFNPQPDPPGSPCFGG